MNKKEIGVQDFSVQAVSVWAQRWILLTSGDFDKGEFNAMTVAWGSIGNVWSIPFVQVFVRHTRYTFEFMERYPSFTVCAFPEKHRDALNYLGTNSGRDSDKIKESGLTPQRSRYVGAPSFEEADLCIECAKMYWQDLAPDQFLDAEIDRHYKNKDYHRVYYGRIKGIFQA